MSYFIEQINSCGRILWLPPLQYTEAAAIKVAINAIIGSITNWDEVAEILDIYGFNLILNINHHGPQDYKIWSLSIRDKTLASTWLASPAK